MKQSNIFSLMEVKLETSVNWSPSLIIRISDSEEGLVG